ncbi:leucine-rich repeat-containing serine/threonine-protein kinase [Luteolibacter flavescens]|uniref:Leucine-rich repeat-containing serine/threonine-protein kinase n=1 Tax=Luteolibacter flavescens TaxID=1859460 RepID=A0ABT3FUI2_9BACT|nr:leucine-rich repeat-containing protein kinase family protein [Luteolibacter flavescens]MCW1887236.1 leucine-rich repeat-containing serine/threonine-protein kinase [Luteolibacter flavescens]
MSSDTLTLLRAGQLAGATRLDLSCGLREFPREIFDLADSLEVLNLSGNRLADLPDDLPRLGKLRILFCSENDFSHVPSVIAECAGLSMVGFKSNSIARVEALPPSLRWLILTDNRIEALPASIGNCRPLQKLMLSGNRLAGLPEEMAACTNLELIRLAANRFESLPPWLLEMPSLAWLAFAGNPCAPSPEATGAATIPWADLRIDEKLGEGASGVIHAARRISDGRSVALKIFKGSITSDGLPDSERRASLAAGSHPGFIPVLGDLAGHPAGAAGLVIDRIGPEYRPLAGPPDFATCSRDVYAPGESFSLPVVGKIARGLASAGAALHAKGILHGDFYAHNVLRDADGHAMLGDFGAASFYPAGDARFEKIEVLAFGRLLGELLDHCDSESACLRRLQEHCLSVEPTLRPSFSEVLRKLAALV